MINITFSTCWYSFKAKFNYNIYFNWIDNMLSNVNNYYLVVYTDEEGYKYLQKYISPNIKIIIKPYTDFFNYQYKEYWIKNHEKNILLKNLVDWRVNMLWSEKIHFVNETKVKKYFDTEFYGWCDIGYFRNRNNDTPNLLLTNWPSSNKLELLNKNKIYYALVNNEKAYVNNIFMIVQDKNKDGIPREPIPHNQITVAGGFFICYKDKLEWWKKNYDTKLRLYFKYDQLVKDDQIIIADCIFSSLQDFHLVQEEKVEFDNWFLFQRYLQ